MKTIRWVGITVAALSFLLPPDAGAQTNFIWTNRSATVTTAWGTAVNWSNSILPAAAGYTNAVITFAAGTGAYSSSNNLAGTFKLNRINFASGTVTLRGLGLIFTNGTGGTAPLVTNYSGNTATISNILTLGNSTTFGAANNITIQSVINGPGQLIKTGSGTLTLGVVANTFSNGLVIKAGTVTGGNNANTFGANTNVITLGDAAAGANVVLSASNGGLTWQQPITVAGGGGTRTIQTTHTTGNSAFSGDLTLNTNVILAATANTGTMAFSGGIAGNGSVTINEGGSGGLTLGPAAINPVGSITNSGTGSGLVTISGAIGANVDDVIQASATSPLLLSGANTYAGNTLVQSGLVTIAGTGSLPGWNTSGRYAVASNAALAVVNAVNDGDLATMLGTGNFAAGAGLGFDTTAGDRTYGVALADTGNGALGLVKLGSNKLTLSAPNTYSGGTMLRGGTLSIASDANIGGAASELSFNGGLLQVTGTTVQNLDTHPVNWGSFNGGFDIADVANTFVITNDITTAALFTKAGAGTLVWSNNSVASSGGGFSFSGGTQILANASVINSASVNDFVGRVAGDSAVLRIQGSTLLQRSTGNLTLGNVAGSTGQVFMTGGFYTNAGITAVGEGGVGSFIQTGGDIRNIGEFDVANNTVGGYGYYQMSGGTMTNSSWLQASRLGLGVIYQEGGSIAMIGANGLIVGSQSGANTTGVLYQTGGVLTTPVVHLTRTTNARGELTVAGTAQMNINGNLTFNYASGTNIMNLRGGVVRANTVTKNVAGGLSILNFDGGTLQAGAAGNLIDVGAKALDYVNVFSGGATIDDGGFAVNITQNLLAPPGAGVTALDLGVPSLGGYVGAPYVGISGGGGTGATAVALFDYTTGSVTGLLVTSAGFNYTDIPTVTLFGGGNTNYPVTGITTNANTSGGLTKLGTGVLTLSGTNTYGGNTLIGAGVLDLASTNAMPGWDTAARYAVSNGAALAVMNVFSDADIATILGTGNFAAGAGLGFDTAAGNREYTPVLADTAAGALGLVKLGANTLTLSAANTFSGGATIYAGALQLGTNGTDGWIVAPTIVNNAGLVFNRSDMVTNPAAISGPGSVTVANGTVVFTGGNAMAGGTLLVGSGAVSRAQAVLATDMTLAKLTAGTGGGAAGAVYQSGGAVTLTNGLALAEGTGDYGYFRLSGGTLNSVGTPQIAYKGAGVFEIVGGTMNLGAALFVGAQGGAAGAVGVLNVFGGTLNGATNSANYITLGGAGTTSANQLNIGGGGIVNIAGGPANSRGLGLMFAANNTNVVNLLSGGVLIANKVYAQNAGISVFNFDGGTLATTNSSTVGATFMTGLAAAYVWPGGAIIDSTNINVIIGQSLLAPDGDGVNSIPLASYGEGYIGAPAVLITGGGGTGATAIAQVDFDPASGARYGQVTNILITSRGVGYTSLPTVTLIGGGATNPATLGPIGTSANSAGGGLTKFGTGMLTLAGVNTYGGNTLIGAGTLLIATTGALPGWDTAGRFAVSNGAALAVYNAVTDDNVTTLLGTGNFAAGASLGFDTTSGNRTNNMRLADTPAGALGLFKIGTNTLVLSGANTYTGPTSVRAGSLSFNSIANVNGGASALGAPTNAAAGTIGLGELATAATLVYTGLGGASDRVLDLAGTTGGATLDQSGLALLRFTSGLTASGAGAKTLTLQGSTVGSAVLDGPIVDSSGGGTALAKAGTGTWILSGANAYSGGTTISAGTLALGGDNLLGSGLLVMNGGALASDGATARVLTNSMLIATNSAFGQTSGGTGMLTLSGTVDLGTTNWPVTVNNTTILSGALTNSGGLAKAGAGTLFLSGGNSFGGELNIGAGIVNVSGLNNYGVDGPLGNRAQSNEQALVTIIGLHFSGGTLQFTGTGAQSTDRQIRMKNGTAGAIIDASGQTPADTLNFTYSNANTNFFDTGGSRTLTLTGSNTGENLFALNIQDQATGGRTTLAKTGAGTWDITNPHNSDAFNAANGQFGGYGGGTTIAGGTLGFASNALGGGVIDFTGSAILRWDAGNGMDVSAGTGSGVARSLKIEDGVTATLDVGANDVTLGGAIAVGTLKTGGLVKQGAGTLTINAANTYAGDTTVGAGTLLLSNQYAIGGSALNYTSGGGTLAFGGNSTAYQFGGLKGDGNLALTNLAGAGVALTISNTADMVYAGSLGDSGLSGSVIKAGAGTLTFANGNAYGGNTLIQGGVLSIAGTGSLPGWDTAGRYTVAGGAALAVGNAVTDGNIATLLGASNFTAGARLGFDTTGGDRTYAPLVADTAAGALGLVKVGANMLTLASANTYSGGTTIDAGTLKLGVFDAIPANGAVTVSGGVYDLSGFGNATNGAIAMSAGGAISNGTLVGASYTFSGGTQILA